MEKLEEELVEKIESLGGEFVPTDQWDNSITHVIAKLQPEKEGLPEKVMGAIAGGKWVLTKVTIVIFLLIFSPPSLSLNSRGMWRRVSEPGIFCLQSTHI